MDNPAAGGHPLTTAVPDVALVTQAVTVLDVTGDEGLTGKRIGKDEGRGKATFVSLLGLEPARARARALIDEAESALAPYGDRAENLVAAARFTISRQA